MSKSLWREMLYVELEKVSLDGSILDLGGSRKSGYHQLLKGSHRIVVANLEREREDDIRCDLEEKIEVSDESYDAITCLNVLEHIFHYQQVLDESHRILKGGGTAVFAVPFLIQVHPSPHDHWRFSGETLERIFKKAGFRNIKIQTIGTGVFGASYHLQHNLLRISFLQFLGKSFAKMGDAILTLIKPNSFFSKEYYPLGYLVIARK